jgi:glycine/D-amino acid oxidase-like deaminating enzyme
MFVKRRNVQVVRLDELGGGFELRCPGGIMVAETAHQMRLLRDKVDLERSHGLPIEMLEGTQLRRLTPYVARHVLGASFCPHEGMANPLLAVAALADAAVKRGARLSLNARVTALQRAAGSWHVATTSGSIRSPVVVIAAGESSGDVAAMAGTTLPLTHRPIQMIATEPCEPFVEHLLYHAESRLTLKQVANGNVLIGGGWAASLDPLFGRASVLLESLCGSLALSRTIVPQLAAASIIRSWAGTVAYTPDGRPILGEFASHPGLFAAVCNTYGFTLGPLCALLVAERVAGRAQSFDLEPFLPSRFSDAARGFASG